MCIPTRGRPACLRRLLLGLAEACRASGRSPEIVAVSATESEQSVAAEREAIEAARARHPGAVGLAGPPELDRYAAALAGESGTDEDLIRFALRGEHGLAVATGGSRNALLLHACGEPQLQLDDDTLPLAMEVPGCRPGLAVASRPDPSEFRFFRGAPPEEDFAPVDPLAPHERLLGRPAAALLAEGLDASRADAGLRRRLAGGGKVLTTMTGVAGHSGMGSPAQLLMLDGESRDRLLASEAVYRGAVDSGVLMRSVPSPTIGDPAFCMALSLGLDNREVLPPFPPEGRGQDAAFGMVLRHCFPAALAGFAPVALAHRPPGRPPAEPDWEDAARPRLGQVLSTLIAAAPRRPGLADAPARMIDLGAWLEEVGGLPSADFDEFARMQLRKALANRIDRLESLLQLSGGRPAFWATDAARFLAALRSLATDPTLAVPLELRRDRGPGGLESARRVVSRYGSLLKAWPALVAAAGSLRSRGVRPAT